MKTVNELRAFCEGYLMALPEEDLALTDCWVTWGDYDINLAGADHSGHARNGQLHCDVYEADWTDCIGKAIHSFTIQGEIA